MNREIWKTRVLCSIICDKWNQRSSCCSWPLSYCRATLEASTSALRSRSSKRFICKMASLCGRAIFRASRRSILYTSVRCKHEHEGDYKNANNCLENEKSYDTFWLAYHSQTALCNSFDCDWEFDTFATRMASHRMSKYVLIDNELFDWDMPLFGFCHR